MNRAQQVLDDAVTDGAMPHAAAVVFDAGGVTWRGHAGPVAEEAHYRLYSMTKCVGAIGAALLVARKELDWMAPVGAVLPEFDALPVLTGFDGDRPVLRPQKQRARFIDLATHMSGSAYPLWQPALMRFFKLKGERPPESGAAESWSVPLVADPGQAWAYGYGPDWLGLAIERLSGRALPEFFHDELFAPLGADSLTFDIDPADTRLAPSYRRDGEAGFAAFPAHPPRKPAVYGMGNALVGTLSDFAKLLALLLRGGAPLFAPGDLDPLFLPQTGPLPEMTPQAWPAKPLSLPGPVAHSAAAMCTTTPWPSARQPGSLFWAGLLNSHYWVDPKSGLGGIFATQMLPFGDHAVMRAYTRFETEVYASFEQKS